MSHSSNAKLNFFAIFITPIKLGNHTIHYATWRNCKMKLPYLNKCHQPSNIEKPARTSPKALKTHVKDISSSAFTLAINLLGTCFLLLVWAMRKETKYCCSTLLSLQTDSIICENIERHDFVKENVESFEIVNSIQFPTTNLQN